MTRESIEFDNGVQLRHKLLSFEHVPVGLDQILECYGNPGTESLDPEWYRQQTEVITLPFPMRQSWGAHQVVTRIRCHKRVTISLLDALEAIGRHRGEQYLRDNDLDFYGGCFNWRSVRGRSTKLSTHCWAIAIDINPHLGPLGKPSQMPAFIVEAFVMRGWVWGGEFPRKDGKHFQACKGGIEMGFWDFLNKNQPANVITETVVGTIDAAADVVDRFIENPEERHKAKIELEKVGIEKQKLAMQQDQALLEDRQSARQMAGVHGKLQTTFALTFLIGFLLLLVGDLAFIGWLVSRSMQGKETIAEWLQILVTNTLTGVLAYMVSMLKEVVGFLFGGSAGGDDNTARLAETLRETGGARAD